MLCLIFFRSQEESKNRFSKTKSLRDKFRDSKTWSLRRSVEKEPSPVTHTSNNHSNCDKNGNSNDSHHVSTSNNSSSSSPASYAGQLSRLFSLRRSLGPGSFEPPPKASMPCVAGNILNIHIDEPENLKKSRQNNKLSKKFSWN